MIKLKQLLLEAKDKCPPATQDIKLNLKNRQKAIDEYGYGPLNPNEPNKKFWDKKVEMWKLDSATEAKKSLCGNCAAFDITEKTLNCIAKGIGTDSGSEDPNQVIDTGKLGYCRFLKFKCAAKRTCDAWVVGGPIKDKVRTNEAEATPIPKNKYIELDKSQLQAHKDILYDLISASYKSKGGNPEFNVSDDIIKSDINIWYAADIDKDPEIDVTIGAKKKAAGTKVAVMGQDGSPEAKKSVVTKMTQLLKKRGYYAELSPDLAQKFNVDIITDEDIIKKVLQKDDIKFTGNGHYSRSIDGITRTKVLVGQPIVTEAYKPMSRSKVIHMRRARKKAKTGKRKAQLRKARLKYKKKKSIVRRKSQQRKRKLGARIKRAAARRNL